MPTTDTGPSPYPTHRSHDGGDRGSRPQAHLDTHTPTHRSRSQGPRDDYPDRRARASANRTEDPRSRTSRTDGPPDFHRASNDAKDAGRPGERRERPRAISVSSHGSFEIIQPPESKQDISARRDDRAYKPSAKDDSSIGLQRSAPSVTSSSGAESPTKHAAASHLPRNPADTRSNESTATHEKDRLDSTYPPMNPARGPPTTASGHTDSRAQAPGERIQQQLDSSNVASSAPPGQLPGTFPPDPPQPSQSQQSRPSQQPQTHTQQAEARESQGSSTDKGFLRAVASVWPGNPGSPPKDKAKEELLRVQIEANNYREDLRRMDREFRAVKKAYYDVEYERNRLRENNLALQHELTSVQRELEEAKALSDIRGRELMGAQVFLTKADSLSISDVNDKVGVLNEEVFQAAAFFAEAIIHKKHEFSEEEMARFYEETCTSIGKLLTDLLHTQAQAPVPEVNPLVAQAVLSSFLVQFCISKLNSWYPSDKNIDQFLGTVYSQIRQNEEQAVFGRWRSLIRAQIRPSTDSWKTELTTQLQHTLNFSSWDTPFDNKKAFFQKLTPIIKALEDLRIAIYEKYTSADLEAFSVHPGGNFESWMEDAYGDERQTDNGRVGKETVAGTTGIGLKRLKAPSRGHRGAPEAYENVFSPKVVLESTLREALEPPPPTKGKKRRADPEKGGR